MNDLIFKEIRRNKYGRRWAILKRNKIIHQGYRFELGYKIFLEILEQLKKDGQIDG